MITTLYNSLESIKHFVQKQGTLQYTKKVDLINENQFSFRFI